MLSVIDKLMIAFIYANIVLPQIEIFSIGVSRIPIAAALLGYGAYVVVNHQRVPRGLVVYVHASLAILVGLATISVVVKGNALSNAVQFVAPVIMLFATPVLLRLFDVYGLERYLRHVLMAILLVAIYVASLFVIWHVADEKELVLVIADLSKTTSVAGWYDLNTVKIHVISGVFFPAGVLLAWLFMVEGRRRRYLIHIALFAFAVTVSFTVGQIMAAAAVTVIWAVLFTRRRQRGLVLALVLLVAIVVGVALMPADILQSKEQSFGQKGRQGQQALALFLDDPVLGRGLGFMYSDLVIPELSSQEGLFVEVSYVMLLASTGLLGLAGYSFIYLYPLAKALLTAWGRPVVRVLTLSQAAIIIAAAGNPYIWAGGVGLFFVAFLMAALEHFAAAEPAGSMPPLSAPRVLRAAGAS